MKEKLRIADTVIIMFDGSKDDGLENVEAIWIDLVSSECRGRKSFLVVCSKSDLLTKNQKDNIETKVTNLAPRCGGLYL
jgi:GTPase SAR1 family protein